MPLSTRPTRCEEVREEVIQILAASRGPARGVITVTRVKAPDLSLAASAGRRWATWRSAADREIAGGAAAASVTY
jgi:hypothetical protein